MTSQLIKKIVTGDEIRNAFLKFYSEKFHKIIPSASLIPDDPTVMLTIAGMLPFKPVFLGLKENHLWSREIPIIIAGQLCMITVGNAILIVVWITTRPPMKLHSCWSINPNP